MSSDTMEEDSERMNETAHLKEHLNFTYYGAALIICSILTYLVDISLDTMVALSYFQKGELIYSLVTILLILIPAICIQIFSIRWLQMDLDPEESLSKREVIVHLGLIGIIHRYFESLKLGLKAKKTGNPLDYQLYYHKQSDVSMLRLFDSFMESAPQLVFHLYVVIKQSQWEIGLATWTALSVLGSLISLGSGIASYSSSMRMIQSHKNKMTWTGMILQTIWRACMLSSRIVALTLLVVALHQWALLIIFIHWLCMTTWVICQDTDFCPTVWEERFYNAIVGVIYCFCFFNLKEGRSRYRASIFYTIIIIENLIFVGIFLWITDMEWIGIGSFVIVICGTILGIASMLLYYGYFHPGGRIKMCVERESYDFEKSDMSQSPDFVIQDSKYVTPSKVIYPSPLHSKITERPKVQHSRSFKNPCPPKRRLSPQKNSEDEPAIESPQDKPDSAYGTDSSQTISRNVLNETIGGETNCSFTPNNETYMSIEKSTPMAASTVLEDNNENTDASYMSVRPDSAPLNDNDTYMSVNSPVIINSSQDSTISNDSLITVINRKNTLIARANKAANINSETLLKRSPVVKDITSGYAQISPTQKVVQRKKRDFTIIVPPIPRLKKHDAPPKLPPKSMSSKTRSQYDDDDLFSGPHDYENMALVNINRGGIGVSHWKTYSDMASFQHDDSGSTERKQYSTSSSTDYESMHYYDVYPLSKKLQDKLVKNLNSTSPESDTYEPIEVFEPNKEEDDDYELRVPVPITLIHHDGEKIVTERVMSMENLKDVIAKHETVPMDDPQDRSDLYLLAPMRILEPILEESEPGDISNKSIMTVLSDLLNKTYASSSTYHPSIYSDGRFTHNIEAGGSSLVQTIEEIRNQSLYSSEPRPKIPPRQDSVAPDPHRDKKIPISTYVGSRKNILDLAGNSTHTILNTPNKRHNKDGEKTPEKNHQENNEIPLSPSVKYEDNSTPTPPPFSRHVQNRAPCRRKFSIIRERYEVSIEDLQYESSATLRPDEKYENFSSTRSRGSWNCSSLQPKNIMDSNSLSQRNIHARRSMSILDDKENEAPITRPLAPKPRLDKRIHSPLTNNILPGSLSPNSRIFSQDI
ncbi:uncharacterized protein [Lepeophtheirus salmonis]|uniref:uncharacterized protein n=1 Tax=Lepeophtheirus salmonis TaxID=72036 RepID=UPI001AEA63F8|nr:uncharacterized protein LOC121132513 [Lepeophtheirus salmonis]